MSRRLAALPLTICAALSIAILVVLPFGYVGWFRSEVITSSTTAQPKSPATMNVCVLSVDDGSVICSRLVLSISANDLDSNGISSGWTAWPARSQFFHSLIDFHMERTVIGTAVRFPIWCLLLPCSVAPVLWLRKRRRRTLGFPVIPVVNDKTT